jgi:fermentation-respiration switch protein FrsA (DUF1100 family)
VEDSVVKALSKIIAIPLLSYCLVLAYLVVAQRSIIFVPSPPGATTPANYGLSYETVAIPVGTEGSLSAWWIKHAEMESKPTVVYCHGNGGTLSSYAYVARIFYDLGWNALIFDYRGYGTSSAPQELSEESVSKDADRAYRWVLERVPEQRVVIWGHSLGGAIAARLASQHSPAGLILEGAFPSLLQMAKARYPLFPIREFMLKDSFDTARYLKDQTFPKLFLHAERDEIIPLSLGEELYAAAPLPKQQLIIKGVGHNDFPSVHEQYDYTIQSIVAEWISLSSPSPNESK